MTGEMHHIDTATGEDSNGEVWNVHAAIARHLDGILRPFDKYQGPYILVDGAKLWLTTADGFVGRVYREDTEKVSFEFNLNTDNTEHAAIVAAQLLLAGGGYPVDSVAP
jgi:hypothetical protein